MDRYQPPSKEREAERQKRLRELLISTPAVKRAAEFFTENVAKEASRKAGTPIEEAIHRKLYDGHPGGESGHEEN